MDQILGTLTMPLLVPSAAGARTVQTRSPSPVMAMVPLPGKTAQAGTATI
jgi:hypothetical protein